MKTLSELVANLANGSPIARVQDVPINGITDDSRLVKPGNLFVAIEGFKTDGHKYLQSAAARGANAAVIQRRVKVPGELPIVQVPDTRLALAQLAAAFYNDPAGKLNVIGITGTNGKTTSTTILDHLLRFANIGSGLIGSLGIHFNGVHQKSKLTTPSAPIIQQALHDMAASGIRFATMEVSSHALALHRVSEIEFAIAAVTNISLDHLDWHKDMEDYIQAKSRLFKQVKKDGVSLFNADDPHALTLSDSAEGRIITYAVHYPQAICCATSIQRQTNHTHYDLVINDELVTLTGDIVQPQTIPLEVPLFGEHNVYNSLLAAVIALICGIKKDQLKEGIKAFPGVPRRLRVLHHNSFTVIDDYAHNPAGLRAVFNALTGISLNNIVTVIAIRGGRGVEINRENARVLACQKDKLPFREVIATKSAGLVEEKDVVTQREEKAFLEPLGEAGIEVSLVPKLADAIELALQTAKHGDYVLLLGAQGMDRAAEIVQQLIPIKKEAGSPVSEQIDGVTRAHLPRL